MIDMIRAYRSCVSRSSSVSLNLRLSFKIFTNSGLDDTGHAGILTQMTRVCSEEIGPDLMDLKLSLLDFSILLICKISHLSSSLMRCLKPEKLNLAMSSRISMSGRMNKYLGRWAFSDNAFAKEFANLTIAGFNSVSVEKCHALTL